ncbi:MAG: hypothetical protein JJU06_06680 [Ectothiorhodospiraceae bacterium]|nr:hypothetical protein [Ectothiorhodospiraceae bacterium]MCH8504723.1 hypothetical protein [Ectothiorhodospiraceae bacterium]
MSRKQGHGWRRRFGRLVLGRLLRQARPTAGEKWEVKRRAEVRDEQRRLATEVRP